MSRGTPKVALNLLASPIVSFDALQANLVSARHATRVLRAVTAGFRGSRPRIHAHHLPRVPSSSLLQRGAGAKALWQQLCAAAWLSISRLARPIIRCADAWGRKRNLLSRSMRRSSRTSSTLRCCSAAAKLATRCARGHRPPVRPRTGMRFVTGVSPPGAHRSDRLTFLCRCLRTSASSGASSPALRTRRDCPSPA